MSRIVSGIFSGLSSLVGVFKPVKKLTEEQKKLIPFRDKAQNILINQGVSKREVKVEIMPQFDEIGRKNLEGRTGIIFYCKGTKNKEEARKSQLAVEKAVLEVSKEIPTEFGTRFFLQVGPRPFGRCLIMSIINGKIDYCDAWA